MRPQKSTAHNVFCMILLKENDSFKRKKQVHFEKLFKTLRIIKHQKPLIEKVGTKGAGFLDQGQCLPASMERKQ